MRKIVLILAVALAVALVAPPASAVSIAVGENLGKFKDVSNIYSLADGDEYSVDPLTAEDIGDSVDVGDEQRTLFQVTNLFDDLGSPYFSTDSPTELTGLVYDLEVLAVHTTEWFDVAGGTDDVYDPGIDIPAGIVIDFGAAGRNPLSVDLDGDTTGLGITGGVMEIYEDGTKDYAQDPNTVGAAQTALPTAWSPGAITPLALPAGSGPDSWVEGTGSYVGGHSPAALGTGADDFPFASDGSYWLAAALLDLNYVVSTGVIGAPAIAYTAGTIMRETLDLTAGEGSGFAYGNIFGGIAEAQFVRGLFPGTLIDLAFQFDLTFPILETMLISGVPNFRIDDTLTYQGIGYWQIDSEDPVVFGGVIPEPATMSLLGLGLIGLVAAKRRKK